MTQIKKEYEVSSWERVEYQPNEKALAAQAKLERDPENPQLWMEKGLALAEDKLYREAGECYSHAIALDPFDGILYRHRGHRMLSQFRFEDACADFVLASRMIPENWDVWYHLGLSYFLLGNYEKAAQAYDRCLSLSKTEPDYTAVCDWYYMTCQRLDRMDKAKEILEYIREDFDPGDNGAYFRRLLMYKGVLKPEEVLPKDLSSLPPLEIITMGFGLSNYYYYQGDVEKSNQIIDQILKTGDEQDSYFAFGYLAAMADKKRRQNQA